MKAAVVFAALVIALFNPVWTGVAAAAEQNAQAGTAQACSTNKSNVTTCKRPSSQDARRQCRWKCGVECKAGDCIEICRGSGKECNGKTPPGW